MPILYVHGVNTRTRQPFETSIREYLRRYVAPVISDQPESVWIDQAYWGDVAVEFAFGGISRPRSRLLGQGAGESVGVPPIDRLCAAHLLVDAPIDWPTETTSSSGGGLLSRTRAVDTASTKRSFDLAQLPANALSDVFATVIEDFVEDAGERTWLTQIADEVANDELFRVQLSGTDPSNQATACIEAIQRRNSAGQKGTLLSQGVGIGGWFTKAGDRLSECLRRMASSPTYAASIALGELRRPLNDLVSVFIGDVFQYLNERVDKLPSSHPQDGTIARKPGRIPSRLLDKLLEATANQKDRHDEPLVVVSHSMGGQLVYDAVTSFMPQDTRFAKVRIDFWCATASQVGFFEEAKLFLASRAEHKSGNPVPFPPSHLGCWWNVWDSNDVLSFTTREIFEGVDDESYSSGMSLVSAHGGYLARPSFYRRFAMKLAQACPRELKGPA